jgi:hypothetical protein
VAEDEQALEEEGGGGHDISTLKTTVETMSEKGNKGDLMRQKVMKICTFGFRHHRFTETNTHIT